MDTVIPHETLRPAIAANVKRLRQQRQLSQHQLAELVDISPVYLSQIENGHVTPGAHILFSLADALGVPTDALRQSTEKIPI